MFTRTVVGIVIAVIAVAAIIIGEPTRLLLLAFLSITANIEMYNAIKNAGAKPMLWPSLVFSILYIPAYLVFPQRASSMIWLLYVLLIMATLCARVFSKKITTLDALASLINFIYPLPLFIPLLFTLTLPAPLWTTVILTGLACACMNDTCALFTGIRFGKHKLSPEISPKKTVEGAVGGFIGAVCTAIILWLVQGWWHASYHIALYVISGAFASIAALVGDLSASAIKRQTGVKDFGKILPGHGGILDRLDSILFAVPVVLIVFFIANF